MASFRKTPDAQTRRNRSTNPSTIWLCVARRRPSFCQRREGCPAAYCPPAYRHPPAPATFSIEHPIGTNFSSPSAGMHRSVLPPPIFCGPLHLNCPPSIVPAYYPGWLSVAVGNDRGTSSQTGGSNFRPSALQNWARPSVPNSSLPFPLRRLCGSC